MTKPKNDTLYIRDARPEELDQVALLLRAAYQEYAPFLSTESWEAYARNMEDVRSRLRDSELIVAERDGHIVGTVTFYSDGSRSQQEAWPSGWAGVRLLAVHPNNQRQGIGRALMLECLQRCRQRTIPTVGLHTTEMMGVARGMYERMGFVRAPEFDFYPNSGTTVMGYDLQL